MPMRERETKAPVTVRTPFRWPRLLPMMLLLALAALPGAAKEQNKGKKKEPPSGDLSVQHTLAYPTRVACDADGRLYVTDARVGSVFVFGGDPYGIEAELKDLAGPLGVAVDGGGNIFVGLDGSDSVVVYNAQGGKIGEITGTTMPNDLALDADGAVYVADSKSNLVRKFSATGTALATIGGATDAFAGLRFPSAVAVGYRDDPDNPGELLGEVYVADQGHGKIEVFDLAGEHLRSLGSKLAAFSKEWKGKFVRLQGLALDGSGRVHALDAYLGRVQILDPDTGAYLDDYGVAADGSAVLSLPLDLVLTSETGAVVTDAEACALAAFTFVP